MPVIYPPTKALPQRGNRTSLPVMKSLFRLFSIIFLAAAVALVFSACAYETASAPEADTASETGSSLADSATAAASGAAADKSAEEAETAAKPQAEAEAAAAEAQAQVGSVQAQAAEMLVKYSAEIGALQTNVSKLADIVGKNADLLPAGVSEKYGELKELVPEVSSMVQSLKDYQGADLGTLVSKIEADYSKATGLYKEAMALIPEGLSLGDVKVPGM